MRFAPFQARIRLALRALVLVLAFAARTDASQDPRLPEVELHESLAELDSLLSPSAAAESACADFRRFPKAATKHLSPELNCPRHLIETVRNGDTRASIFRTVPSPKNNCSFPNAQIRALGLSDGVEKFFAKESNLSIGIEPGFLSATSCVNELGLQEREKKTVVAEYYLLANRLQTADLALAEASTGIDQLLGRKPWRKELCAHPYLPKTSQWCQKLIHCPSARNQFEALVGPTQQAMKQMLLIERIKQEMNRIRPPDLTPAYKLWAKQLGEVLAVQRMLEAKFPWIAGQAFGMHFQVQAALKDAFNLPANRRFDIYEKLYKQKDNIRIAMEKQFEQDQEHLLKKRRSYADAIQCLNSSTEEGCSGFDETVAGLLDSHRQAIPATRGPARDRARAADALLGYISCLRDTRQARETLHREAATRTTAYAIGVASGFAGIAVAGTGGTLLGVAGGLLGGVVAGTAVHDAVKVCAASQVQWDRPIPSVPRAYSQGPSCPALLDSVQSTIITRYDQCILHIATDTLPKVVLAAPLLGRGIPGMLQAAAGASGGVTALRSATVAQQVLRGELQTAARTVGMTVRHATGFSRYARQTGVTLYVKAPNAKSAEAFAKGNVIPKSTEVISNSGPRGVISRPRLSDFKNRDDFLAATKTFDDDLARLGPKGWREEPGTGDLLTPDGKKVGSDYDLLAASDGHAFGDGVTRDAIAEANLRRLNQLIDPSRKDRRTWMVQHGAWKEWARKGSLPPNLFRPKQMVLIFRPSGKVELRSLSEALNEIQNGAGIFH